MGVGKLECRRLEGLIDVKSSPSQALQRTGVVKLVVDVDAAQALVDAGLEERHSHAQLLVTIGIYVTRMRMLGEAQPLLGGGGRPTIGFRGLADEWTVAGPHRELSV